MAKGHHIDEQVLEQAGDFYLALQDGSMDAEGLKAWQAWMVVSDDHRRAFARMESLWGILSDAPASEWQALEDCAQADMKAPDEGTSVISFAAARGQNKPAVSYGWISAIAATIAIFVFASFLMFGSPDQPGEAGPFQYQTVAGQHRVINLADGSIVELGAASSISVAYSEGERAITLGEGEAVFTVAKNPNRPFVVRAGQGSVTAIGTVFNVRKSASNVEVRVLEGTVAVRPVAEINDAENALQSSGTTVQPVTLVTAGRQTAYSQAGVIMPVVEANVHEGLSWRVGVLTMVDWSISDVIQELNRYLADEITIGDDVVGAMRFTGTVYPDQVDAWLEGLQQGYPIEVVRLGSSTILMFDEEKRDS